MPGRLGNKGHILIRVSTTSPSLSGIPQEMLKIARGRVACLPYKGPVVTKILRTPDAFGRLNGLNQVDIVVFVEDGADVPVCCMRRVL